MGGLENMSFTQFADQLLARSDPPHRTRHVPLAALRMASILARAINPEAARKAQAALVMNTIDMTFEAQPVRDRFPDIPITGLADLLDAPKPTG